LALADVYKSKPDGYTLLAFLFFFMSLYFPAPRKGTFVGAATVPQFWTLFLAAMAVTILVRTLRAAPEEDKPPDGPGWWSRLSCW
nr:hypothetical protein [Candidatus Krumholzibacteria bacterium]